MCTQKRRTSDPRDNLCVVVFRVRARRRTLKVGRAIRKQWRKNNQKSFTNVTTITFWKCGLLALRRLYPLTSLKTVLSDVWVHPLRGTVFTLLHLRKETSPGELADSLDGPRSRWELKGHPIYRNRKRRGPLRGDA